MRRKRQFIRTARYQRWRVLRWGAWLIPLVNFIRAWNQSESVIRETVASASDHTLGMLASASILLLQVLVGSFPLFFLWWGICTMLLSRARREASFVPERDLTYYREQLNGLSAVQVSLLADLRIEPREDAAATLLALERRGILTTEGECALVVDESRLQSLSLSDQLLARLASTGKLGVETYGQWAELAEQEAVDGIHLRRVGRANNAAFVGCSSFLRGCGAACIIVFALCFAFALFSRTVGKDLMEILDTAETDYEMVALMIENPALAVQLLIFSVIALVLVVAFLLPLFDTVRGLIENGDASRHLRRTPQGEQEAECVYGIRNYLRDFTAISDADRKALVLWDDFFVYAVALGQNPRAVNELLRVWKEHDERE